MKMHNFTAGPCILAPEVFEGAAAAVREFEGMGLSLLEVSHRDKKVVAVMEEAQHRVLSTLGLGDNYAVLFLQGGASSQFAMVPFNLLTLSGKAGYLNTGTWASRAVEEAEKLAPGQAFELASSKDKNFSYIPKGFGIPSGLDYMHYTSNNTIFGTQMKAFPKTDSLMVCDMSSDIFSRQMDYSAFDLIYAGAQKNLGPAGATLVVVRKEILGKSGRVIPTMFDYPVHIKGESMYNTPPVFSLYVSLLTLRWMESQGGLPEMERRANARAAALYGEIDRNPLFVGTAATEDRSPMNACFLLHDEAAHKDLFDGLAKEAGLVGLAGHRSVGGYRASMYNALEQSSVDALVEVMREVERRA
jgi:phosphoserine aminotransferase